MEKKSFRKNELRKKTHVKEAQVITIDKKRRSPSPREILFTPKSAIKKQNENLKQKLEVSLWSDMESKEYPQRKVLVSNLIPVSYTHLTLPTKA